MSEHPLDISALEFVCHDISELGEAASLVLERFAEDRIFVLKGQLGAGKTTFVQALAQKLGIEEAVTSPSFALVQKYTSSVRQDVTMFHIDLYRLNSREEALDIGIEEYLDSGDWCFVEWPGIIEDLLGAYKYIEIQIEAEPDGSRKFRILKR